MSQLDKYDENKWLTERASISKMVAAQQPNPNLKYNERTGETSPKLDTKTYNRDNIRTTTLEQSVMKYWGGGGGGQKPVLRAQPHPSELMWYKHLVGCEKTGIRGFRPGPTQTRLYTYRS